MKQDPKWLVFIVGLLLLIALWERYPKVGAPLTALIALYLALKGWPEVTKFLGLKGA